MEKFFTTVIAIVLAVAFAIGVFLLKALVVQLLMNYLFAAPFTPGLDYTGALALTLLCRLLFGNGASVIRKTKS